MKNHFEFRGGILFCSCSFPFFLIPLSFVFFFCARICSNYEFKGCTKKSVTVIIELIYVVWLLLDSVEHDDAAICRLVFIHFGTIYLKFFLLFLFIQTVEIVDFVSFQRKKVLF